MALDPLALFDLATLKAHCKITEATQDDELVILGNAASAFAEQVTGQAWKVRDYTIVRNGDGRKTLLRLPRPIVSVTSFTADDVAYAASDYVIFADAGKITLKSKTLPDGVGNIVLALSAGYAIDHPKFRAVAAAALDLAKSHYDEWQAGAISISSISVGPATAMIRPGLNPRITKYLESMRDVRA